MLLTEIIFQSSPWYAGLCLLAGALYAFLLYQPKPVWSQTVNGILAFLRGALVSFIAFLLLGPLLRSIKTLTEKPKVVIAIDNSESLGNYGPKWLGELNKLRESLADEGLEVAVQTLDNESFLDEMPTVKFNLRSTNLSKMLATAKNNYEGRNLTDVILLTDGISNQGLAPTFGVYPFRIHSVGLGDTLPKRDVSLKTISANKIAYLGNQFPIQVDVVANGFAGRTVGVVLKQNGKPIGRQTVTFKQNDAFQSVTFQTTSTQKGVQHYVVEVEALAGEFTTKNNRRDVYLDIIDGKEKILLLALAPHPDLKALRSIIERNLNYELDLRIMGANPTNDLLDSKYDLLIFHQLPDYFNTGNDLIRKLLARDKTPVFFILGNQSSATAVSQLNTALNISAGAGQIDKVTGRFNANFKSLNLNPEQLQIVEKLPPLTVPFGEYSVKAGGEVVLLQNVGNVKTNKALLALNTSGERKSAVLAGEGIWQWRLEEYALTEKQEAVDELFLKVMQLISVKEDRRKFRVYPLQNELNVGEKLTLETEVYNDIYEKTYGQNIRLELTDERGKSSAYSYVNSASNSRFEQSGLAEGVYRYKATTSLKGRIETAEGQFVVRDLQLEALNLTADFGLLRQLSAQTGGQFTKANQLEKLKTYLTNNKAPSRLESSETLSELIQEKWLFFLLLLLLTAEWGIRKYQGSY